MKHIVLFILIIIGIGVLGVYYSLHSNAHLKIETISGVYQTKIKQDISQLTLSKDGSYKHEYHRNNSSCSSNGSWYIEDGEFNQVLVLKDSDLMTLGTINSTCTGNRGYVMLQIKQFLGKIKLEYDIDLGLAYEKISSQP